MIRAFLAVTLLLGPCLAIGADEPVSVDRTCGRIVSVYYVPDKGTVNSSRQEVKPFPKIHVRLFSQIDKDDCCSQSTLVAEAVTGRDGSFDFKKVGPGDYWLVATISGAECKTLIRYRPDKKSDDSCSDLLYTFDKGNLRLERSITVTVS